MDDPVDAVTVRWAMEWLVAVADGSLTMSQRKLSTITARPGGLSVVQAVAEQQGVHLAVIVDDHGEQLVVASRHVIRVLC